MLRPIDDPDRKQAEIELNVKRRDTGELFRWGLLSHSYGRLGCGGCAYDYVDTGMGMPAKVINSRLCEKCFQGIQHSVAADTGEEAQEAVRSFWAAVGDKGSVAGGEAGICPRATSSACWRRPLPSSGDLPLVPMILIYRSVRPGA